MKLPFNGDCPYHETDHANYCVYFNPDEMTCECPCPEACPYCVEEGSYLDF